MQQLMSASSFVSISSHLQVLASLERTDATFELLRRARHVCSEAERVFAFQAACEGACCSTVTT